jgi:aminoglycoside phosphotransferase (APT) family kinase protein
VKTVVGHLSSWDVTEGDALSDDQWPDAGKLGRWMAAALDDRGSGNVDDIQRMETGYSAETVAFTFGGERFVVRSETDEPPVYPQQAPGLDVEIAIQYRTMRELADRSPVPIAPLVGYEDDVAVLGRQFFVMGFVDGEVPKVSPSYTSSGFFAEAASDQRRAMVIDGLRRLAEIHAIDWRDGFDWLVPPGARPGTPHQLALWEQFMRRELGERTLPVADRAFAWLHANLPASEPTSVTWGDPRLGNMIWRDFRCVCVTDFENVAVGSPDQDLGWWLMFDRWSHETFGAQRLPGEPSLEEQRELYAGFAGRDLGDTTFHEIFAALRYSAIIIRVMNRSVARGQSMASETFWRDNPSSQLLATMLDEA